MRHSTPPDLPRRPRLRSREGRCFELSFQIVLDRDDWALVHGLVNGAPPASRIEHAWVERSGIVYDPVLDRAMPLSQYRREFAAVEIERYDKAAACRAMLDQGHSGPWIHVTRPA